MKGFIKVTSVDTATKDSTPVFVNINHICSIHKDGKLNIICRPDGAHIFIKESPEEIIKLIEEAQS